ncbi:MAG: hypothetical protein M3O30_18235 [Planctomycetota bacterium]|nr:hypothetical protein [Planctomycetota bacterium]
MPELSGAIHAAIEPLEYRMMMSVTLSASAVSSTEIDLTYSSDPGTSLELEQQGPQDVNFSTVYGVTLSTATGSHMLAMSASPNGTYSYRLREAINNVGTYAFASATAFSDSGHPDPGTGDPNSGNESLSAPSGYQGTDNGGGQYNLDMYGSYTPGGVFTSSDIATFYTQVQDPSWDPLNLFQPGAANPVTSSGPVTPGVDWGFQDLSAHGHGVYTAKFKVKAVHNSTVAYSGWSSPITVDSEILGPRPDAPSNVQGTINTSAQTVHLTWSSNSGQVPNLDGFGIWGITDQNHAISLSGADATATSADESLNPLNLPSGQHIQQIIVIAGANSSTLWGDSNYGYASLTNAAPGINAPAAPKNFTAQWVNTSTFQGGVNLLWDNTPGNEDNFIIKREALGQTEFQTLTSPAADTTGYLDSTATPGTYTYEICATNSGGQSAFVMCSVSAPQAPQCSGSVGQQGEAQVNDPDLTSSAGPGWAQSFTISNDGSGSANTEGYGTYDLQMPHLLNGGKTSTSVTLVNSALNQSYFDLVNGSYVEAFGGTDSLTDISGHFTLTDSAGTQQQFYDFTSSPNLQGKFIGKTDASGNAATVTSTDSKGNPTTVQLKNGGTVEETWIYSYISSGVNAGFLSSVAQQQLISGSWTTIRSVNYTYYDGSTGTYGLAGDLEYATVLDSSSNIIDVNYFRYYTGTFNSTTNPGIAGDIKFSFGANSYARLKSMYSTPTSANDSQVTSYADTYFAYDSSNRITTRTIQGEGCSACSAGQGTYTYTYSTNSYTTSIGVNIWTTKVVTVLPDSNIQTDYSNYQGQVMLDVFNDTVATDPNVGQMSGTFYEYNAQGLQILMASPSAVNLPSGLSTLEPYADLLHSVSGNYAYLNDGTGKIDITDYYASSDTQATPTTAGGVTNYVKDTKMQQGETNTAIMVSSEDYIVRTAGSQTIYPVFHSTQYRNTDGTGAETTTNTYAWYSSSIQMQFQTTSYAVISSAQNGPGASDTKITEYDTLGRVIWSRDGDGFINYTAYDPVTGAVTKTISDVNTSATADFSPSTAPWTIPAGGGAELITSTVVDAFGRPTKITSPTGNVTYMVYFDAQNTTTGFAHEVRTYPGWHYVTGMSTNYYTTTGPVQVSRYNRLYSYNETLTYTAPQVATNTPDGSDTFGTTIQTLSRQYISSGGQTVESDAYYNLNGMSYSSAAYMGSSSTNYYATTYGYDHRGRQNRVVAPTGTITRTVYDGLGRVVSTWVGSGTDDTPSGTNWWSPAIPYSMTEVSSNVYDSGNVGDGNLTKTTQYPQPGTNTYNQVTLNYYDWRDRLVASKGGVLLHSDGTLFLTGESSSNVNRLIHYTIYDNLDEVVEQDTYAGDGVGITTTNGVPNAPTSSKLRARTVESYDDQGRVYQTQVFSVDPSSGTYSQALTTQTYYDHRGDAIETIGATGLVTKTQYDGAGRPIMTYITDGGAVNNSGSILTGWTNASSVSGDIVIEQTADGYDKDGNLVETVQAQRFSTDPTSANTAGEGALFTATPDTNGYGGLNVIPSGPSNSFLGARLYYNASYYDAADRDVEDVNVGSNAGTTWYRPISSASITPSDTVLVTSYNYSFGGWQDQVTDPRGIPTKKFFDALGRKTQTIVDYTPVNSNPTPASNQTTAYTYDGDNHVLTMKAMLPGTNVFQTTTYVYGVSTANGSLIDSNDLLSTIEYPDLSTGASSTSGANDVSYTYDALGRRQTMSDRNGNIHGYQYDPLGRLTMDFISISGSGVDSTTGALEYNYNQQGLPYQQTTVSGVNAWINQVQDVYNGLGQLTGQYQSTGSFVTTSSTPEVIYGYSSVATGSLPTSMTYPNGRILHYGYGTSSSYGGVSNPLDAAIGRIDYLADDNGSGASGQDLEEYSYLGLSTIVTENRPAPNIQLTYLSQTSSVADAGDQYTGLDRFGRVAEQNWIDNNSAASSPGSSNDDFKYGYDATGNVVYKRNALSNPKSERFDANSNAFGVAADAAYDGLGRLTAFRRGSMNSANTYIPTASLSQSWSLDALGNQLNTTNTVSGSTTTTTNAFNSQNQQTVSGSHTLTYDQAGDVLMDENGTTYTYDAWNRMTTGTPATGGHEEFYTYNALGQKVTTFDTLKPSLGPIALLVNNGNIQRSMVDSLTLEFNVQINTPTSITLTDGSSNTYSLSLTNPSGDRQTWLISFTSGTVYGSLPDGQYTLSVPSSGVTAYSGGGSVLSSNQTFYFHRLFGDFQGTGTHTAADGNVWNALTGVVNPNTWMADYDHSGTIDQADYVAYSNNGNGPYTDPTSTAPIIQGTSSTEGGGYGAVPTTWTPRQIYYSSQGQDIEEDAPFNGSGSTTPVVQDQQVWGIAFVNELVLRDDNSTGSTSTGSYGKSGSGLDERLYAEQDANYNVTSLTDTNGNVVQRYMYDPYGNVTVMNYTWSVSLDQFNWTIMDQGGMWDPNIKQYFFNIGGMGRNYDPATGRWGQQDRAGYAASGSDLYLGFGGNPATLVDPLGLAATRPSPTTQPTVAPPQQGTPILLSDFLKGANQNVDWGETITPKHPQYRNDIGTFSTKMGSKNGKQTFIVNYTQHWWPNFEIQRLINPIVFNQLPGLNAVNTLAVKAAINAFNEHTRWHEQQHVNDALRIYTAFDVTGVGEDCDVHVATDLALKDAYDKAQERIAQMNKEYGDVSAAFDASEAAPVGALEQGIIDAYAKQPN